MPVLAPKTPSVYARHLLRRRVWRAASGDATAYQRIMRAHLATGHLFYYDDEPEPRSATAEIWRTCLHRAALWTVFYVLLAAVIVVAGALGCLDFHLTVR